MRTVSRALIALVLAAMSLVAVPQAPPAEAAPDELAVSGTGRYVRVLGTTRATQYGYSLWDLAVYGTSQ